MRAVYERIRKVAPSDCTVLMLGETGTGKELAARAIHQNSPRARARSSPSTARRCPRRCSRASSSATRRAPSPARVALKKGRLEVADGGTVFLDEIGELAPALQAKLLRVLQDHEFERVGGTRVDQGRRPRRRRHQPGPRSRGGRRALPPGPLLPPQRRHLDDAAAARAPGRHPAARCALRGQVQQAADRSSSRAKRSMR